MSMDGLNSRDLEKSTELRAALAPDETKLAKDWLPHIWADPDFREFIEKCDKVLTKKGHDYTQGDNTKGDALTFPGRLKNFYTGAQMMPSMTAFKNLGVLLWKHITAVYTFLDQGQVESEPIEERLVDTVNYVGFLLFKMVRFEQRRAQATTWKAAVPLDAESR